MFINKNLNGNIKTKIKSKKKFAKFKQISLIIDIYSIDKNKRKINY